MNKFELALQDFNIERSLERLPLYTRQDVEAALEKSGDYSLNELAALISPAGGKEIEKIASCAHQETLRQFGRTILLYIPLYLSNVCINNCCYCGFSSKGKGYTLSMEEVVREAQAIYDKGFRHILLVAGEYPSEKFRELLLQTVKYLRPKFSSISIEIATQTFKEYKQLVKAGVDSLTLYQETYHRPTYVQMHTHGPKADYSNRLEAVERAARAGMRRINLGALLGLYNWQYEFLSLYLHYRYLMKRYWKVFYSLSFPRLRNMGQIFTVPYPVDNKALVQMILAARLAMPEIGLVISTRESPLLRDYLIGLGITQMSAGSSTRPGGYTGTVQSRQQFEIADNRSVEEIIQMIRKKGYDPVWKDWEEICYG